MEISPPDDFVQGIYFEALPLEEREDYNGTIFSL